MLKIIGCYFFALSALYTSECKVIKPAISKSRYKLERPLIVGDEIKAIGIWKLEENSNKDPKFK